MALRTIGGRGERHPGRQRAGMVRILFAPEDFFLNGNSVESPYMSEAAEMVCRTERSQPLPKAAKARGLWLHPGTGSAAGIFIPERSQSLFEAA